jgi:hypothetical protein
MMGRISPAMPIRTSPTPAEMRKIFLKSIPPFAALTRFGNLYLVLFATRSPKQAEN